MAAISPIRKLTVEITGVKTPEEHLPVPASGRSMRSRLVIPAWQTQNFQSSEIVQLEDDETAVTVEVWGNSTSGATLVTVLDMVDEGGQFQPAADPAGQQWVRSSYAKFMVRNTLPYVTAAIAPSSGGWQVRITPSRTPVSVPIAPLQAPSGPSSLPAATSTLYTWPQQVRSVVVQNNTQATVNFAIGTGNQTATAGSTAILAGETMTFENQAADAIALYCATAQTVNGTAAANIVVLGGV